jgi:hypothetical protein
VTSTEPPIDIASDLGDDLPELEWPTHESAQTQNDQFLFELIEYLAAIRDVEPGVTAAIVGAIPEGARPYGLDCRVKDWESLHRKAKDIVLRHPDDFDQVQKDVDAVRVALKRVEDILRYSVLSAPHVGIPAIASSFIRKARDVKIGATEIQNSYYPANRYKGLHTIFSLAKKFQLNLSCEVQFHSAESVAAYRETHADYEIFRVSKDAKIRQSLHDKIAARYGQLDDLDMNGHGFPVEITKRIYRRPGK